MEWLAVTLALYAKVFRRAAELIGRNWPVLGTVFVYSAVLSATTIIAAPLGLAGGFLAGLVWAGCVGSFLFLVETMVRTTRVSMDDLRRSAGAYLGEVLGISFLVWIVSTLGATVLAGVPQGRAIFFAAELVALVLLNAVPELIYLGRSAALELVGASFAFVRENWVEWFPPTLALMAGVWGLSAPALGGLASWIQAAAIALLLYFGMVVRGLLFIELHGTSRRSRAFRHRMGG